MHSLPSQAIRPLSLNPFSFSLPIFHKFKTNPTIYKKSQKDPPFFILRCCSSGSVTANPSSELRRNRAVQDPDEKVVALRQLFSKPGIGTNAYIIPYQDAHQVSPLMEGSARQWLWNNTKQLPNSDSSPKVSIFSIQKSCWVVSYTRLPCKYNSIYGLWVIIYCTEHSISGKICNLRNSNDKLLIENASIIRGFLFVFANSLEDFLGFCVLIPEHAITFLPNGSACSKEYSKMLAANEVLATTERVSMFYPN